MAMLDRRKQNLGSQEGAERRKSLPLRRELAEKLGNAVIQIEAERKEREELERKIATLEEEKYTDSLTGLLNRRSFDEKFPELVDIAQRNSEPLALLFVDSNNLHTLNKTMGHSEGDSLLKKIAATLKETARVTDLVARTGGDEFTVVLTGFKPVAGVTEQELMDDNMARYQSTLGSRATLGIALLRPAETASELYDRADAACTANKPNTDRSAA